MDFKDLKNNMNNSDIDESIEEIDIYRKYASNINRDILIIQTPYINSNDNDLNHNLLITNTDLNHDSFFHNFLNIFNCFSSCNYPDCSCPHYSCPDCGSCPSI